MNIKDLGVTLELIFERYIAFSLREMVMLLMEVKFLGCHRERFPEAPMEFHGKLY